MKDLGDLVQWIIGVLTTFLFFSWRYDKSATDKKLDAIYDRQRDGVARLAIVETKISSIQVQYSQTLDDIKAQQIKMAEDVTAIKIAVASIPKRRSDED